MLVEGFEASDFNFADATRTLYKRGSGPGVVVMHEVPGITPAVQRFARRVAEEGFTVYMPHLFGTPGRGYDAMNNVTQIARACVAREFHVLASQRSSPITDWLRALCRHAHAECGGVGVGAIGMCLTGNFALALMVEPCVMAPVLSQPSLPFVLGSKRKAAVHVSDEDLRTAARRARDDGAGLLGLRFTHDFMCPKERFDTLREAFGDGFEAIEIDSSPGNPHGIARTAHSVVARDLVDEEGHPTRAALERVLALFRERLLPAHGATTA
jgi:dienelactone hydrolase